MDNSLSDEDLVKTVLKGDENATYQLYERYCRLIYSTAYRIIQNAEEAQDTTQEIFLKLYRSLRSWDSRKSKFSAWVYRLAANQAIDCWRARHRRAELQLDENVAGRILRDRARDGAVRSPFSEMEQKEGIEILRRCVDTLPELQKKVFVLRYFGELKLEEIAEAESCSLGTVKSALFRATQTVRKNLGRYREVCDD
jgi:RNA polymerase sigma factor (sigma-70 family)